MEDISDIFRKDLPGYNHFFSWLEVTFKWASKARPQCNHAKMPDYNFRGMELYNEKARKLIKLGVLRKAAEMNIQPGLKITGFLLQNKQQLENPGNSAVSKMSDLSHPSASSKTTSKLYLQMSSGMTKSCKPVLTGST